MLTKLWRKLLSKEEVKIVIVGLDNAGKTTVLYKLYVQSVRMDIFQLSTLGNMRC